MKYNAGKLPVLLVVLFFIKYETVSHQIFQQLRQIEWLHQQEQFPNKNIFIKMVSVISNNLQSMYFIVLKRVCVSSLYMGQ